ncbi:unnamed protein product [Orchesella dallaii]|uniref:Arrestin C-terminal-like domain-containing protein n=1 Tax=Orchesella dallaii TaxID=48710 RepID=A0ABP1PJR5_9HEXA
MIPLIFLLAMQVVAVKVFKKTAPNGKVTVYLGKRDFVDRLDGVCDPVDGVIVIDNDYLRDRRIYGQVMTTFRYGREEDEVMGLKFSKDMVLCKEQVVPPHHNKKTTELSPIQEKLLKKLDNQNAFPFTFNLPELAPPSVTLQHGENDAGRPLGVEYEMKAFVADNDQDPGHRRSTVSLRIRKVQHAALTRGQKQPSVLVSKGFTFSAGKINLEVTLDRDIYYHGEEMAANVHVSNTSKKSVRNIKVMVVQHCEVTMVNAHFTKTVAHLETREGCPITPGASLTKSFHLRPCASNNKDKRGIALDGHLKDEDVNLASTTMVPGNPNDALGFVVSYSLRVKLHLGTLGGELQADLPFKLVHPGPDYEAEDIKEVAFKVNTKREAYQKQCYAKDAAEEENIVFEDFAKLRMSMSEIDN